MEKTQKTQFLIFFVLATVFFIVLPATAQAASLYFSPSSGSYAVGSALSVSVYVSSADQTMNAASGIVSFPQDKLEVVSLSKSGSIMSLWVQEPAFSNALGTVNFEGIVLNPGFTGSGGKIINITFRVKAVGTANLNFSSGSLLANDGQGTNILTSLGNASFSLGIAEPAAPEAEIPPTVAGAPVAPQVSSLTHPDPNKWYATDDAKFTWPVPSDVTATRLLVGKIPNAVPTVYYSPAISSKELSDLEDGIWYFHVRLRNGAGWGGISHFRFQIDTKPPEPFEIEFIDGKETDNPQPIALFNTTDSLSGIGYYKIKIGEGDYFNVSADEVVSHNPYKLPLQAPGKRTLLVQAYDKAGNFNIAQEEFVIKPIASPKIIDYPARLESGGILIVKGKTKYPDVQINIFLQHEKDEPKSHSVKSDKDGEFTFVGENRLKDGIYKLWAEVVDERGARSEQSEKVIIAVERPVFIRIGSWAVGFLSVFIPLVALIFLITYLLWHWWHKFAAMRKRVRREIKESKTALHQAFKALEEETEEQIAKLDGRPDLSAREKKICDELKKALKISEKFIGKEIEDIEKKIKK